MAKNFASKTCLFSSSDQFCKCTDNLGEEKKGFSQQIFNKFLLASQPATGVGKKSYFFSVASQISESPEEEEGGGGGVAVEQWQQPLCL